MSSSPRRPPGFTLIEVLVVLAIIGAIVGLLMPAVQKAREAGNRAKCQNNLKQVAIALQSYHDVLRQYPSAAATGETAGELIYSPKNGYNGYGWRFLILPHLEQSALYAAGLAVRDDQAQFEKVVGKFGPMPVYYCPSSLLRQVSPSGFTMSSYLANAGERYSDYRLPGPGGGKGAFTGLVGTAAMPPPWGPGTVVVRMEAIADGASNTLLVGERPHMVIPVAVTNPPPVVEIGRAFAYHEYPPDWTKRPFDFDLVMWAYTLATPATPDLELSGDGYNGAPCPPRRVPVAEPHLFSEGRQDSPCDIHHWWSQHPGGGNFALADGSVRFFGYAAGAKVIPAMATRAGGEVIPKE